MDAAVLLIAGEWDPATSPRWARLAAEQFSKSQVVIAPKQGHILDGIAACVAAMTREFLDRGRADPSCAMHAARPSYAVR